MAIDQLGRLDAVHRVDPAYMQRAVFITLLSFLFFFGTTMVLYYRGGLVYFVLSTAFLIIYLLSLFSIFRLRRAELRVYESGFSFRGRAVFWSSISSIDDGGLVTFTDKKTIVLPRSLSGFGDIVSDLRRRSLER